MTIENISGETVPAHVGMRVWPGDQTGRITHVGNETVRVQVGISLFKGVTREQVRGCR